MSSSFVWGEQPGWWCAHHPAGRYILRPILQQLLLTTAGHCTTTTLMTTPIHTRSMREQEHDVINTGSGPMARLSGDDNGLGNCWDGPNSVSRVIADVRATSVDVNLTFAMSVLGHTAEYRGFTSVSATAGLSVIRQTCVYA
jgi:hypothetical protein